MSGNACCLIEWRLVACAPRLLSRQPLDIKAEPKRLGRSHRDSDAALSPEPLGMLEDDALAQPARGALPH